MRARVISALFMVLALAFTAQAEDGRAQNAPSLARVLPQIRRNTPGRFYDAEGPFVDGAGRATYRIKWMTPDGRIIWFDADAYTGRVMNYGGRPYRGERDDGYRSDHFDNGGWGSRDNRRDRDNGGGWDRGDRGRRDGDRGGGWGQGDHGHGDGGRGGNRGGGDHGGGRGRHGG